MIALPKIEIDVAKTDRLDEVAELARQIYSPTIVVPPELVASAAIVRGIKQATFRIITTVDWPKGEQYGREKFRGLASEALNADGFEIIPSARDDYGEVLKEIQYLSSFFGQFFNPLTQFRLVLNIDQAGRPRKAIENILNVCKHIPMPQMIRTVHTNKLSPTQVSVDALNNTIATIKRIAAAPVKVSGALDAQIYNGVKAEAFAGTVPQVRQLLKDLTAIRNNPPEPTPTVASKVTA